jgi:hypothetical protein
MYRKMELQPQCMQALQQSYQSKAVQNTYRFIATAYKKNGKCNNTNEQNKTGYTIKKTTKKLYWRSYV